MRSRSGWVFMDILVALMIVAIVGLMLGVGATWHHRALTHLADTRAATRIAESALISMQAGQRPDEKIVCRQIAGGDPIPGMAWVQVTATVHGRSASLVGLVPQKSLSPAQGS